MEIMQDHWQKYIHSQLWCSLCLRKQVDTLLTRLYLYGGYQILKGGLQDFYSISLEESEETFNWVEILPKGKVHPGSREKHALVSTKSHIYLIGGILLNNSASNDIFRFDPKTQIWELMVPEGDKLPPL